MLKKCNWLGRFAMAVVLCGLGASGTQAAATFEWIIGQTEAQCDNNAAGLEAQNDSFPAGQLNWTIGYDADIPDLTASASPSLTAMVDAMPDGRYAVTIEATAEVYANLQDPLSSEANAETFIYFQLAITIPAGNYYAYTLTPDSAKTSSVVEVEYELGDFSVTEDGVSLNDSLDEEAAGILTGRADPYLLYGGFRATAHDGLADGIESTGYATQNVLFELEPVPEPATVGLLVAGSLGLIRRRRGSV